jgi:hypothetical protein
MGNVVRGHFFDGFPLVESADGGALSIRVD